MLDPPHDPPEKPQFHSKMKGRVRFSHYGPGILGEQMFTLFFIGGVIFLEYEDHRSARLMPDLQLRPFDQYEPEAGA